MPFSKKRRDHCEKILDSPFLRTPPSPTEGEQSSKPTRKPSFICPPKFPLLTDAFYEAWCKHKYQVFHKAHTIDISPPVLFPEVYLKPRLLNHYADVLQANVLQNTELIKRINRIQRSGGYVDCWNKPVDDSGHRRIHNYKQMKLKVMEDENRKMYKRLKNTGSSLETVSELENHWKDIKRKLVLGSKLPYVLFDVPNIDKGIRDPVFTKSSYNFYRDKVQLVVVVSSGAKLGRVTIELFSDVTPRTCELFLSLLRGDPDGYAYAGTRIFRIVPRLYCVAGDVAKDTGFGSYHPEDSGMVTPENFILPHSMPGILSMVVSDGYVYTGQFNIIFKTLDRFDGKHVVFGRDSRRYLKSCQDHVLENADFHETTGHTNLARQPEIINGPRNFLEELSGRGLPLGGTSDDVYIAHCEYINRKGKHIPGIRSQIKYTCRRKSLIE